MRRNLLLMLAMVLVVSLIGCSGNETTNSELNDDAVETVEETTENEDETAENSEEVTEESGDVLRIGMEAGYPPFNWTQKDDSNGAIPIEGSPEFANGYDVQIAKIIGEALGKEVVAVKTEWDGLVPALTSGKIDMIMAGMSPTAERALQIDFSDAYYNSDLVLIVNENGPYKDATSLADFNGARVVAQLNTFHDKVVNQIEGVEHLSPMPDFPILRVAVQSDKADAYVAERPEGKSVEVAGIGLKMIDLTDGFETSPEDTAIAVGIQKGSDLTEQINEVLAGISNEDRLSIMDEVTNLSN